MKQLFFLLLVLISNFCLAQSIKRKLIWEDNFNGTTLNQKFWNFEIGNGCPDLCGWGNNEQQIYTDTNYQLKKGKLVIIAKKEGSKFTSTKISTASKKEFQYGRIEIKAKLPVGTGLWPAFWMLGSNIKQVGWPKCGEIDILEYVGREPSMLFTSLHTEDSHGKTVNTRKTSIPSVEKEFHVYAIDWNKNKIEFFIDNKSVYNFEPEIKSTSIWPYNQPFYLILNLAIGGDFGGPEVDEAIFPQEFSIDYIKVFQ